MDVLLGVPHADAVNAEILVSRIVRVWLIIGDRIEALDTTIDSEDHFFTVLALIFPAKKDLVQDTPFILLHIRMFQLLKILSTDTQTVGRHGLDDILRRFEFGVIELISVTVLYYHHLRAAFVKAADHTRLLQRAIGDINTAFADPLVLSWRPVFTDAIDIDLVDPCAGETKGGPERLKVGNCSSRR